MVNLLVSIPRLNVQSIFSDILLVYPSKTVSDLLEVNIGRSTEDRSPGTELQDCDFNRVAA
jgi:hypothetical protein